MIAAVHDPKKLFAYLNNGKQGLRNYILNTKNIYLQQMISLSVDKNMSEFLPFVIQLAEGRITSAEILENRADVTKYFQLLVNTLADTRNSNSNSLVFQQLLRRGLKEKAMYFYAGQINELHNEKDITRFASVKNFGQKIFII
jgi:hypothetical protein